MIFWFKVTVTYLKAKVFFKKISFFKIHGQNFKSDYQSVTPSFTDFQKIRLEEETRFVEHNNANLQKPQNRVLLGPGSIRFTGV